MLGRHPSDDALEQLSLGRLAEQEAAEIEEHLLICVSCQDRFAEMDAYVTATRSAALDLRENSPSRWADFLRDCRAWLLRPAPAIAVAGVLFLLLFWSTGLWRGTPTEPAVAVSLFAVRGAEAMAQAPAGKPLSLRVDVAGLPALPTYKLEIVDRAGEPAIVPGPKLSAGTVALPAGLRQGRYWIRVYDPASGALLREYGLETR